MRPRFPAQVCLVACCLVSAAASGAQQVRGRVTQAGAAVPVVGAVVSVLDSADRALASTTTDTSGRYAVAWRSGTARLRVVRLGFRPTVTPLSGVASDTTIDVRLERLPAMIAGVNVRSQLSCPSSPDRRAVLALWDQGRAGLLAAVVARQQQARVTALNYERYLDAPSERVRSIRSRVVTGASNRPFLAARSADEFERTGFVEVRGGERTFFAPDADVLLDDRFAATHCFGLKAADDAHPGQFGLAFAPQESSGRSTRVDISGVLWVDPRVPTLTHLEFSFNGPQTSVDRTRAGGDLRFVTAANGALVISTWSMTIPAGSRANVPGTPQRVTHFLQTGGLIAEATWPDGFKWRSPLEDVGGRVVGRDGKAIADAVVTVAGWNDSVTTNMEGVFLLPLLPPGSYRLEVSDTSMRRFVAPRSVERALVIAEGKRDSLLLVQLPPMGPVIAAMCKGRGNDHAAAIIGYVGRDRAQFPGTLTMESDWESRITIGMKGEIAWKDNGQAATLDDDDRFLVCAVERGRSVRLWLYLKGYPVADTVVEVGKESDAEAVEWLIKPPSWAAAARGAATALLGTVIDGQSGAPVPDAEIWMVLTGAQMRADSTGRFDARKVPPGRHVIQIRRLGYIVLRDTITLLPGVELQRTFRLESQALTLDTVTTTSSGVKYTSPLLRAFEDRRATGAGHFIGEAELRKNDGKAFAWLELFKRIPGTKVTAGTSGEHLESLRRPGSIQWRPPRADPNDIRSPRGCWVSVYVDGVPIYLGPPQRALDLRTFPAQQFAGIEYYSSNASMPAQYSAIRTNECGVLLLWTRER